MTASTVNSMRRDLSALSHQQQIKLATQVLLNPNHCDEMEKFLATLNHVDVTLPHTFLLDALQAIQVISIKFELATERALRLTEIEQHRAAMLQRDLEDLHFDSAGEAVIAGKSSALADAEWGMRFEALQGYAACVALERLGETLGLSAVELIANAPERVRRRLDDEYPDPAEVKPEYFEKWVDSHYRLFKNSWPLTELYQ